MGYLDKLKGLFTFSKSRSEEDSDGDKVLLGRRYRSFQRLLACNNEVLELMADMEEKLSGDYLFDRQYIIHNVTASADLIKELIDRLNDISGNAYQALYGRFDVMTSEIADIIYMKREIPDSPYTISLNKITRDAVDLVGGKNANLGEMKNVLGLNVPEGFAITSAAYKRFMSYNGFLAMIHEGLAALSINDIDQLNRTSGSIREAIVKGGIPEDLEREVAASLQSVLERKGRAVNFSVRSSALEEDGDFSFAGQYSSVLNVAPSSVMQTYKEVLASLFSPRAIFYYKTKDFNESDLAMAVGVIEMVDARCSGVMYSLDPLNPEKETILINAVQGLGTSLVDGAVTPESYVVAKDSQMNLVEHRTHMQETMAVCSKEGDGIREMPVSSTSGPIISLNSGQVQELARCALTLEKHYSCPQDVEWAIDGLGQLFILQTRPLGILSIEPPKPLPRRIEGYRVLIDGGVIASRGIGYGKACHVYCEEDLAHIPEGSILIARRTSPQFVVAMQRVKAIVTNVGGPTGHMASLAREFQVPALLDTGNATDVIPDGMEVTVDAVNGNVYEGYVPELIEYAQNKKDTHKNTILFKTLSKVLQWIVPLNLVNPLADEFAPGFCKTFHDITRFAHEKAMSVMFTLTDISTAGGIHGAQRLVAGLPIEVLMLDLGGGIDGRPRYLNPEHVRSEPFNAFFKGLSSMKWPQARPFDVKGFMGMIAHSASLSEAQLEEIAKTSFVFVADHYMNFSVRLGYHLSTVEAYAGEHLNDNYIKFHFKGGGANADRRLRRVKLISDILRRIHFDKVVVVEDVIDAITHKYRKAAIEKYLEIMGRLTVYTKQLDMVMYNDEITEMYTQEFVNEYMSDLG